METARHIRHLGRMSRVLIVAIGLLIVIGVLFVRSACFIYEDQPGVLWLRQLVWVVLGTACCLGLVVIDYRRLCREAWWTYGVAVFLLVLVLVVGETRHGGRRWLYLFGIIGFQPSEFAKLALIVLLARLLSRPHVDRSGFRSVVAVILLLAIPVVLVIRQPDVGTAMAMFPITFVMMLAAGVRGKVLLVLLVLGVLILVLVLGILLLPEKLGYDERMQNKIIRMTGLLEPYHKHRIAGFLDPGKDPLGRGWSKIQSEIAIGSGAVWGKGYGKGTANLLGFLPRTVAPTDFIFSVIAEETGFVGSVVVIILYGIVLVVAMRIAVGAADELGRLLCVGVTTMLFFHIFVNIAMTIGLMPIVGLPLPLMSSGGSFMISTLMGIGIIQSVHVRRRSVGFK